MTREEMVSVICCCGDTGINNYKMMTSILWIKCLLKGGSPLQRLRDAGVDEVIIYGITELGELLVQEALNEDYKIMGITDKKVVKGQYEFRDVPIITVDEMSNYKEKHIVVTAVMYWDEIKRELNEQGYNNVIVLWELM